MEEAFHKELSELDQKFMVLSSHTTNSSSSLENLQKLKTDMLLLKEKLALFKMDIDECKDPSIRNSRSILEKYKTLDSSLDSAIRDLDTCILKIKGPAKKISNAPACASLKSFGRGVAKCSNNFVPSVGSGNTPMVSVPYCNLGPQPSRPTFIAPFTNIQGLPSWNPYIMPQFGYNFVSHPEPRRVPFSEPPPEVVEIFDSDDEQPSNLDSSNVPPEKNATQSEEDMIKMLKEKGYKIEKKIESSSFNTPKASDEKSNIQLPDIDLFELEKQAFNQNTTDYSNLPFPSPVSSIEQHIADPDNSLQTFDTFSPSSPPPSNPITSFRDPRQGKSVENSDQQMHQRPQIYKRPVNNNYPSKYRQSTQQSPQKNCTIPQKYHTPEKKSMMASPQSNGFGSRPMESMDYSCSYESPLQNVYGDKHTKTARRISYEEYKQRKPVGIPHTNASYSNGGVKRSLPSKPGAPRRDSFNLSPPDDGASPPESCEKNSASSTYTPTAARKLLPQENFDPQKIAAVPVKGILKKSDHLRGLEKLKESAASIKQNISYQNSNVTQPIENDNLPFLQQHSPDGQQKLLFKLKLTEPIRKAIIEEHKSEIRRNKLAQKVPEPVKMSSKLDKMQQQSGAFQKPKPNYIHNSVPVFHDTDYYYRVTNEDKTRCLICKGSFKFITKHYKEKHKDFEVLISRISQSDLQLAEEEAKQGVVPPLHGKFQCRLCPEIYSDLYLFKDHCTFHTGEYSYSCRLCNYRFPMEDDIKSHWKKHHSSNDDSKPKLIEINIFPMPKDLNDLPGYVCPSCNFLQLSKQGLERHMLLAHGNDSLRTSTIKRINMVMHLPDEEQSTTDTGSVKRGRKKRNVNYQEVSLSDGEDKQTKKKKKSSAESADMVSSVKKPKVKNTPIHPDSRSYKCSDNDGDDVPCIICGEQYKLTTKSSDWIKCIKCNKWLHADCSAYDEMCTNCGNIVFNIFVN